jgi:hypothetical protein
MGFIYGIRRTSFALAAGADFLTITAASGRSVRICKILVMGAGTASAANEFLGQRSTGGTTSSGTTTPAPFHSSAPAAAMTVNNGWTTQPSLSGNPLLGGIVNANGGMFYWQAIPGREIEIPGGGQFSLRQVSGTSNVVLFVEVEEI